MININAVCRVCNSNIPLFNIEPNNKIRIKRKIACCGVEVIIAGTQKPEDIIEYLNKNDFTVKAQKNKSSKDFESQTKDNKKKKSNPKKVTKDYTVTISYIRLTDNEARVKRAILTSIMKKSHLYKDSLLK